MVNKGKRGSQSEQQDLRCRLVAFLSESGADRGQASALFGLSRSAVDKIWARYKKQGAQSLLSAKRGPKAGSKFNKEVQEEVGKLLLRLPDELGLPQLLWSREGLGELLQGRYGISLSSWQIGRYLRLWGCEEERPSSGKAAAAWKVSHSGTWIGLRELRQKATAENAEIVFLKLRIDRNPQGAGLDHPSGPEAFGIKEHLPWPQGGWLMAERLKGKGVFMALHRTLDAVLLRQFLERLNRESKRKIYAILPVLPPELSREARKASQLGLSSIELLSLRQQGHFFLEDCPGPGGYRAGAPCLASCPYAWISAGLPCEADRDGDVIV